MLQVKVYHTPKHLFRDVSMCFDEAKLKAFFDKNFTLYNHVADVECVSMDMAFQFTNTIHQAWWENEEVTTKFEGDGCRSTSVGDLFIVGEKSFLVAHVGFVCIKGEE